MRPTLSIDILYMHKLFAFSFRAPRFKKIMMETHFSDQPQIHESFSWKSARCGRAVVNSCYVKIPLEKATGAVSEIFCYLINYPCLLSNSFCDFIPWKKSFLCYLLRRSRSEASFIYMNFINHLVSPGFSKEARSKVSILDLIHFLSVSDTLTTTDIKMLFTVITVKCQIFFLFVTALSKTGS